MATGHRQPQFVILSAERACSETGMTLDELRALRGVQELVRLLPGTKKRERALRVPIELVAPEADESD